MCKAWGSIPISGKEKKKAKQNKTYFIDKGKY
jgi:hypothetical protein